MKYLSSIILLNCVIACGNGNDDSFDDDTNKNLVPVASFTSDCSDLVCNFNAANSTDSDGTISSYTWDLGDGNTSTEISPTNTYASNGVFDVFLTVTDNDGASNTSNSTLTVSDSNSGGSSTPSSVNYLDWSLPEWVQVSLNGAAWGNFGEPDSEPEHIRVSFLPIDWKEINATEGVFDFSQMETALNAQGAKPVVLRVNWYGQCAAPAWVLSTVRVMSEKTLVFWEQAYRDAITPLISELATKYANDPRIEGIYLGIGDGKVAGNDCAEEDGWGEFWMTDADITEAENNFGFSETIFENETKKLLNIFSNAFGSNRGKLAITNTDRYVPEVNSPYNTGLANIAQYAFDIGLGMRNGAIESWGLYLHDNLGTKFTAAENNTSKLSTDQTFANAVGSRYWGDENEFYGTDAYITEAMGPYSNQDYRHFVSTMRSLQMRYNYVAISPAQIEKIPDSQWKAKELLVYQAKTFGRNLQDTPDAFSMLGERYIAADSISGSFAQNENIIDGMFKVRGVERWLTEIGSSEPAYKIQMPASENLWGQGVYLPEGIDYEYAARKSNQFHFDIFDDLISERCASGCEIEIKISFLNDITANVWIETEDVSTESFSTSIDNKVNTITFPLNSKFTNALSRNSDFIIHSDGNPLSVVLVRVVFVTIPN